MCDRPRRELYLLFIWVVWFFQAQITVIKGQMNDTNNLLVQRNLSCTLLLTNTSIRQLATVKKGMEEGEYDIVHIKIDVINDEIFDKTFPMKADDKSDILTWIIATENGKKHIADVSNNKKSQASKDVSFNIQAYFNVIQCDFLGEQGNSFVVKQILYMLHDNLKGVDQISEVCHQNSQSSTSLRINSLFQSAYICYNVACLSSQKKTCGSSKANDYLLIFVRVWTGLVLLYSPGLVYILFDCLHLRDENHKFYHATDRPYSWKRILAMTSFIMINVVPKSKRDITSRPLVRTAVLVWIFNLVVQIIHLILYFRASQYFAFATYVFWSSVNMSYINKLVIIEGSLLAMLMIIIIILMTYNVCGKQKKIFEDTYVYVFSSAGALRSMFLKKRRLRQFKDRKTLEGKDGQALMLYHIDRFTLLFHAKFWRWLFLASFSTLLKKRGSVMKRTAFIILGLLFGIVCFVIGSLLNLLWGLFPLIGVFLSVLSTTKSWMNLLRALIFFCVIALFLDTLVANNLVFTIDVAVYVMFFGLLSDDTSSIDRLSQAIVLIGYLILYWSQFIEKYKIILDVLFEVENELLSEASDLNKGLEVEDSQKIKSERPNDVTVHRISFQEFEFISEHCLPVRKMLTRLMLKVFLTGTFLLVSTTVLFLKYRLTGFSGSGKLLSFLFISVLPKIIETMLKDSYTDTNRDVLKLKVATAVKEWKNIPPKVERIEPDEDYQESNVECSWVTCCWTKQAERNNEISML